MIHSLSCQNFSITRVSKVVQSHWSVWVIFDRELAIKKGAWANIPPKSNSNDPICFSPYLYRARNRGERFFNRIKQCRRVAMPSITLPSFSLHPSGYGWLRVNEST